MILAVILLGMIVSLVQASLVEWVFHKYWLHRPWAPKDAFVAHTMIHHQLCKFDDTFHVEEEEQEEALEFQWWVGPLIIAISLLPWWGLASLAHVPTALCIAFAVPFTVVFSLYHVGFVVFHELMHKPRSSWFEKSRYFAFVKKHHRIHHYRMNRNLNVVLPIADFFLRTLVIEAEVPATTPASARTLARKHSKFGARMRRAGAKEAARIAPEDPARS